MVTCSTIHIHTARIGLPLKKMLLAQDAASARSQKQEERPGVLQEEGKGCREQDQKAKDRQDDVKLKAKDSTTLSTSIGLHPRWSGGEEASMSIVHGGARQ